MKARTERTGKERKALVEAITTITGEKATYLGMPTAGYEIGSITVDRDGSICCENEETMKELIASLADAGISAEIEEDQEEPEKEEAAVAVVEEHGAEQNLGVFGQIDGLITLPIQAVQQVALMNTFYFLYVQILPRQRFHIF